MDTAYFRAGRFFYHSFLTGEGSGWFFNAREGEFGPYKTKLEAQTELELFIQRCIEEQKTGGRLRDLVDDATEVAEEIVAAPPPEDMQKTPMPANAYFEKMRAAVRERANKYMGGQTW